MHFFVWYVSTHFFSFLNMFTFSININIHMLLFQELLLFQVQIDSEFLSAATDDNYFSYTYTVKKWIKILMTFSVINNAIAKSFVFLISLFLKRNYLVYLIINSTIILNFVIYRVTDINKAQQVQLVSIFFSGPPVSDLCLI